MTAAGAAPRAFAYGDHDQVEDPGAWSGFSTADKHAILEFLSRGTPAESEHYATTSQEQAKAQDLEDAYNDVSRPEEAKAALTGDAGAASQRAKFLPSLDDIHTALLGAPVRYNLATALLTADVLLIGHDATYLMRFFDKDIVNPSPPGTWSTTEFQFVWHSGGAIYSPPAPQSLPSGVYATHVGQWSSSWVWSDDDPFPRDAPPYTLGDGVRYEWDENHGNWDVNGQYLPKSFEYFVRLEPGDRPFRLGERPRQATPSDTGPTAPWDAPADPSTNLGGHFGDRPLSDFRKWACHVLQQACSDPYRDYHMTPECSGMTYSGCVAELRSAGFTGDVHEVDLTADNAYMEGQAGRVTTTKPAPDLSIVEDRSFEIFINPDPLPTVSSAEQSLASNLKAANAGVVTDDNKLTLAKQCLRRATAASRPSSDCLNLPIFVTGDDAVAPAQNDLDALESEPQWFALNHRLPVKKRQWWKDNPRPTDGCVRGDGDTMARSQCDEFPFWSTSQAYEGSLQTAVPHVRWTPGIENGRQGTVLAQFYSSNSGGSGTGFDGCDVPGQSASSPVPEASSTFLNLPLPAGIPFPSTGICNRAARGL